MSKKNLSVFSEFETNFEKHELAIRIVFGASIVLCPTFFGFMATSTGGSEMIGAWGILTALLFYLLLVSGILLYRNSSKTGVNKKLGDIESKADRTNILLEAIAKKLGVDIDSLDKKEDKDERKQSEHRTGTDTNKTDSL